MAVITSLLAIAGVASAARVNVPRASNQNHVARAALDQVFTSSITDSSYNGHLGEDGLTTNISSGMTYWLNGGGTHNTFGNLNNFGNLYYSQTQYLKTQTASGMTANFGKNTATDGNLYNSGLIQLNDIGSTSAPSYQWLLRSLQNDGVLQLAGRGDTGGSTMILRSDVSTYNNGIISLEQVLGNKGEVYYSSVNGYTYNNGAIRLINTVWIIQTNIYGNGCFQIGAGGDLYLQDGAGNVQNPTKGPSMPNNIIAFTDNSSTLSTLHLDTYAYAGIPNFGPMIYGFGSGDILEFYETIRTFAWSSTNNVLTVTMTTGNYVNFKFPCAYDSSKFVIRGHQTPQSSYFNYITYDAPAPSGSAPIGKCLFTTPAAQDLGQYPPSSSSSTSSSATTSSTSRPFTGPYTTVTSGTATTTATLTPTGTATVGTVVVGSKAPFTGPYTTVTSGTASTPVTQSPSGTGTVGTVVVGSKAPFTGPYTTITGTAQGTTTLTPTGSGTVGTVVVGPFTGPYTTVTSGTATTTVTQNPSGTGTVGTVVVGSTAPFTGPYTTVTGTATGTTTLAPSGTGTVGTVVVGPFTGPYTTVTSGTATTPVTQNPTGTATVGTVVVGSKAPFTGPYTTVTGTAQGTTTLTPIGTGTVGTVVVGPFTGPYTTVTGTAPGTTTQAPSGTGTVGTVIVGPFTGPYTTVTSGTAAGTTTLAPSGTGTVGTVIVGSTAVSSTTAAVPTGSGSYLGCYTEATNGRALSDYPRLVSASMTRNTCRDYCATFPSKFYGVEYGTECYCGDSLQSGSVKTSESDCSFVCPGNSTETCGAGNRLNVFSAGAASVSTSSASSSSSSSTSTAPASTVASTTSSSTSSVNTASASYTAIGCYTDLTQGARALDDYPRLLSDTMTPKQCNAYCVTFGAMYAGVEYGRECYCGNTLKGNSTQAATSDCNFACPGDVTQNCGAGNRLSLSQLSNSGGSGSSSSSSSSVAASTTSASRTTSSSSSATSTAAATTLACPGSDQTTYKAASGTTYLIECYNDHAAGDLSTVFATTLQSCIDQCDATTGCVAYSWVSQANGVSQPCYLKSSIGANQNNSAVWGGKMVSVTSSSSTRATTAAPTSTNTCPSVSVSTTTVYVTR